MKKLLPIFSFDMKRDMKQGAARFCLCFIFTFHFLISPVFSQGTWSPRTSFPDSARGDGIGFSIGNYGYIGLGCNFNGGNHYYHDFWQFNPSTDMWAQKANFPGLARIYPATFVIGNYAYVVTGQDTNIGYLTECWQYNSLTDTWTQKANFPGSSRAYGVGFTICGKGCVGLGSHYDADYCKDFWTYDTATDTWTRIADFGGSARFSASGFSVGDSGYVCFGQDSIIGKNKDIWEYDTITNRWTQKSNYPGYRIYATSGFVIGTNIYVGTGEDTSYITNKFWLYNTSFGTWNSETRLPGHSRAVCSAFSVGDTGYAGLGEDSVTFLNSIYRFYPDSTITGIRSILNNNEVLIYPNPFKDECFINLPEDINETPVFSLFNMQGLKQEINIQGHGSNYTLESDGLKNGVYILVIKYNDRVYYKKLIITD